MTQAEQERYNEIIFQKVKPLYSQVKKYADAAATAKSWDEVKASRLVIYKLLNEITELLNKL